MPDISRRNLLVVSGATAATISVPGSAITIDVPAPLRGKSILITGTSSGFGRHGALLYARSGARVFATMRNLPRPEAEDLRRIARDERLDLHVLELDVLSEEQVSGAVSEAERINGGPLDVLVNNAGINIHGPVEVQDIEATRLSFETNVYGPLRLVRAALPGMRRRKAGLIVNVSSQVGRVIMPYGGVYSATKFALESMSEQLAYEVAQHGIEVCIIQPGGYPTNIGVNRAKLTAALVERAEAVHTKGYPEAVASMRPEPGAAPTAQGGQALGRTGNDPDDVPRAIAAIAAMAPGTRPLRRPVHPRMRPQEDINRISVQTQLRLLGDGPDGLWIRGVLD